MHHIANSVSIDNTQLEILKILKELKVEIKYSNESRYVKNPVVQNPGSYTKTPDNATKKRWNTRHYCWTHGACNHSSNKCIFKVESH